MQNMNIFKIFLAVFFAGVASLQMELSLLREASFILGSTALTNSYIISVFLAGLALGAYGGNLLIRLLGGKTRELFIISQVANICLIILFLSTKDYVLYGDFRMRWIFAYFGLTSIIPAIVGGMAFALFLNMLYEIGEKYIAFVYALSTAGNVLSGLCHGLLLVPYFGMRSTYLLALVTTGIAILLIFRFQVLKFVTFTLLLLGACVAAITLKFTPEAMKESILWSKDDVYGLVQVVDRSELWKGWNGERGIDLLIHNHHNCANSEYDVNWHEESAIMSMSLLDNSVQKVILLGYCSGCTVSKFLDYENISKVISVELNKASIEAAELFFSEFHEGNIIDKRFELVVDEFRSYMKWQPKNIKYDIVMVDITIQDPYFFGMFTREFFAEIYKHLEKPGVVFFHYSEFIRTVADIFDHIYQPKDLSIAEDWYFCTNFALPKGKSDLFFEVFPLRESGLVFTDHKIYSVPPLTDRIDVKEGEHGF